jgi:AcrR family transcriptional regulator
LADIVLAEGLADFGLRRVAARLATSDRMLLYYFGAKAELVLAVLIRISERLSGALRITPDAMRMKPDALLARASAQFADPAIAPFMRVWIEVSAIGARGEEPYRAFATQTIAAWLDWLDARLDLPAGQVRKRWAAAILTILEGVALLELSRPLSTTGVGDLLSEALAKKPLGQPKQAWPERYTESRRPKNDR